MFSTPESGKISDRWTAVRILGGDDLDDEGRAFMQHYRLRGYPSLLAITAGGALLDQDLSDGRMRNATYLYQAMERADQANQAFLAERTRLLGAGDAASLTDLAGRYEERLDLDGAREIREKLVVDAPTPETYERLLLVLARLGDVDAEEKLLDEVVAKFPQAENRMGWRMRRVTLRIPMPTSEAEEAEHFAKNIEALEVLRAEIAQEGDAESEAAIRTAIAQLEMERGDAAAGRAQVDWIFEHTPDGQAAVTAHLLLARWALEKRDTDTAKEHATWVLEKAPEGPQAATAHMMLGDVAYGDHDLDGMEEHFSAVVRLAPDSGMAENARSALRSLKSLREREAAGN